MCWTQKSWTTSFDELYAERPLMEIHHFNIDMWGDVVEDMLSATSADIVCFCEHRQCDYVYVQERLRRSGWISVWGSAVLGPNARRDGRTASALLETGPHSQCDGSVLSAPSGGFFQRHAQGRILFVLIAFLHDRFVNL